MPLAFAPTVLLPDVAPGPHVELLVSGINANLVPEPSITDATTWTNIIAGTYPGIDAPTTPSFWSRDTGTFATTPASLRLVTTTTLASGSIYLTPWIPAQPGMQVQVSAAARVTVTDSSRLPAVRVVARNSVGGSLTVNAITWPTTVNASFTTVTNTFTLPADTVEFRVQAGVEGTATNPFTVFFDDFLVVLQPGATTVTVSRLWEGEEAILQGAYQVPIVGDTMLFYDYGAPFTTDIIYKAVTETGSTLREYAQSGIVRVEAEGVWISDSLSPEVAMKVTPDQASFKSKVFTRAGGPMAAVNRKRRPAIVGTRQEGANLPFSILTYTVLQRLSVETILNNVDPLMIRCSSDHAGMPSLAFITAEMIEEVFIDAPEGETCKFNMKCDFVASPGVDIVVPVRTYEDYLNEFTSYGDTTYASYLALLRG